MRLRLIAHLDCVEVCSAFISSRSIVSGIVSVTLVLNKGLHRRSVIRVGDHDGSAGSLKRAQCLLTAQQQVAEIWRKSVAHKQRLATHRTGHCIVRAERPMFRAKRNSLHNLTVR